MEKISEAAFVDFVQGKTIAVSVKATHKAADELKKWLKEKNYKYGSMPITDHLTQVNIQVTLLTNNTELINRLESLYPVV